MNNITPRLKTSRSKILFARELRRRMTPAEIVFWKAARNRGLLNLKFRRQQVIDGFIVDFYCHDLNLAIELDGKIHESTPQKEWDRTRDAIIRRRGIRILRIKNAEVFNSFESVKEQIREIQRNTTPYRLKGQATSPPGPFSSKEKGVSKNKTFTHEALSCQGLDTRCVRQT